MKTIFAIALLCLTISKCYGSSSAKANASSALFPSYPATNYEDDEDKSDSEMETLQKVEKKLRSFIDAVIRQLLPYVIRASSDISLSGRCIASFFKLAIGIQRLQEWAVKMIDATGKPPSGVIQGTSMALGDFDECVNVQVGRGPSSPVKLQEELFHGKYCIVECKLPPGVQNAVNEYNAAPTWLKANTSIGRSKTIFRMLGRFSTYLTDVSFRFGICVPSTCDEDDLESVIRSAVKTVGIPLRVLHCEEKRKITLTTEQLIAIPVLGIIITIVLVATAAEIYLSVFPGRIVKTKSQWRESVENLSLLQNTKKLFNVKGTDNNIVPIIQGMLFITVSLNVLANTYFLYNEVYFQKYSSLLNMFDYMKQFTFIFIANGSNGIENYFFLAGFAIAFVRWRIPVKTARLDLRNLLLKPFIRMTLLQLLTILIFFCTPIFGYGPFWRDFVDKYIENCRQRWWINLLFIQNYWSSEVSCLYHTWLLAVLMQLYLISAVIIWLLIRKPNFGVAANLVVIVVGMAFVGATVFAKELPGTLSIYLVDLKSATKVWNNLYIQTFDHVGTFCIGILTGYSLAKYQHNLKLKPVFVLAGWIVSSASLMAVIFGLYEYRRIEDNMNPSVAILYAMLNRNVYSLFLAWLLVACATGNAWWIPHLLSWKALVPFYRLSFLAYLIHLVIIYYHVGITRERVYMSHEENIMNYLGYLMLTYFFSFLCYIFFQAPYMHVERLISTYLSKRLRTGNARSGSISITKGSVSNENEKQKKFSTVTISSFVQDTVDAEC